MIENQSPDRAFIHEAIDHVANLGYLTLPERRVLLRNTIKVLRQSQNIDHQPLPPDEQVELRSAPKLITPKELSISAQVHLVVSPRKIVSNRKYARKAGYVTPKAKHWYTNGKKNGVFDQYSVPKGWKLGQVRVTDKPKVIPTRRWYNRASINKQFRVGDVIPSGWKLGRVITWKCNVLRKAA